MSVYVAVLRALQEAIARAYDARERGAAVWRGSLAGPGAPRIQAMLPEPGKTAPPLLPDLEAALAPDSHDDFEVVDAGAETEAVDAVGAVPDPRRVLVVDALMEDLEALEANLLQHTHLEDDILLPRLTTNYGEAC